MHTLRALIRVHRHLAVALLVLAFCIKAVIPAGLMVSASPHSVLAVTLCAEATGEIRQIKLAIPRDGNLGSHSDDAKKNDRCAFSGLSQLALGGADAALLAVALAFVLVLGFAPMQPPVVRQFPFLYPPLRGPPSAI